MLGGRIVKNISRRRLVNMLRWFRNKGKQVNITYEYNNSMGHHDRRSYSGIIKDFEVKEEAEYGEYKIIVNFVDGSSMDEYLDSCWEFYGLGMLRMCNSGPYCYFTVRFSDKLKNTDGGFSYDDEVE